MVEYSKDKFACELLDEQIQDDRYRVIDDIIYYKNKIFLVPESPLKKQNFAGIARFTISRASGLSQDLQTD